MRTKHSKTGAGRCGEDRNAEPMVENHGIWVLMMGLPPWMKLAVMAFQLATIQVGGAWCSSLQSGLGGPQQRFA